MGNVIGERRLLVFEINDIEAQFDFDKAGYFKMHEYSLCGVNKDLVNVKAILRIWRDEVLGLGIMIWKAENLTSKSEMSSGVDDNINDNEHLTLENLLEMDNGFGDFDDFQVGTNQYNNDFRESNEFVGGLKLVYGVDEFRSRRSAEDICMLRKRKLKEENLYGTKRTCLQ
ncbi:hypothetical protein POM88_034942 [Heracleum sosnowskyi]|uniref:Uncharacterized protein n=1 Tax=Heracleum sosnowskyi TaxID=360622 RepID=A0AAD8MB30_9APIA|nr:hypothetical protein POM88_034942 [Heracleum sosnowskyi]